MPDLKWLDEILPDNEKWQQWRGNLIEFKDNIKDNIAIGKLWKIIEIKNYFFFYWDPRIKSLTESKLGEFRSWFDQRLDNAIEAADQQNGQLPPAVDGNFT